MQQEKPLKNENNLCIEFKDTSLDETLNLISMSESLDPVVLPIEWNEATRLIYDYHSHPNSNKLKTFIKNDDGSETEAVLSGFSLKVDEIRALLDQNQNNVHEIFVAIGYHNKLRSAEATGHSGIFFGVDDQNNLLYTGDEAKIFNYSMPCPTHCPKDKDGTPFNFSTLQPVPIFGNEE